MNPELLSKAKSLWDSKKKLNYFEDLKDVYPLKSTSALINDLYTLNSQIPEVADTKDYDSLYTAELKRRLHGEATLLEKLLSGRHFTFDDVIEILGLQPKDLNYIKSWLQQNHLPTKTAIERIYQNTPLEAQRLPIQLDIPSIQRQVEGFTEIHIADYHVKLGRMLEEQTAAAGYLRDIQAIPTYKTRSYFSQVTKTLAISMAAICYMTPDRTLRIKEKELITLYGHEGMGHGLKKIITDSDPQIPFFLQESSKMTIASEESLTQFYEQVIFEDLKNNPDTQKELGIAHRFAEIYQDYKDSWLIENYKRNFSQYGIIVLADKSLGDPNDPDVVKKKIDLLSDIALDPRYPIGHIESNRHQFDSQGNLNYRIVDELRYSSRATQHSLDIFKEYGLNYHTPHRTTIDLTLLKGFWTPKGMIENAEYIARTQSPPLTRPIVLN